MLAVEDLSIQFGARTLFSDLTFSVRAKERLALAGPNGAGKSTLLKIIAGLETTDTGRLVKARQATVGYLPQEGVLHSGRTLFSEVERAFDDVMTLREQLHEVEQEMATLDPQSEGYAEALEIYGDVQMRLEHHDLSRMKPRIETVLYGLGFSPEKLDLPTESFSGGWQMRIALAKLLLSEPSILLLDEPTNHLDIEAIQWLEQWLRNYGGAILLISHDRALLDALTTRTLAFEGGKVRAYSGNYSFFLSERAARREQLLQAKKNQTREIEKAQQLIDRFRAKATKARMVQSRIKQLEKVEIIEVEEEEKVIGFNFPQPERSGQTVVKMLGIQKYYGDLHVLRGVDFELQRGDRVALVGVNGAGKSTFSRILAGAEAPTSGTRELGHKVGIAYFSQNHADELDPSKTVLETVEATATRAALTNLRTTLGAFLFRGDDVFKSVKVLSGGERSRLALARMLLQPANLLILDEPTNHLDMASQEMLQRALDAYTGTYAIVSHNRAFLDPIVTKVLEFVPGRVPRWYHGNMTYFLEKKAEERAAANAPVGRSVSGKSPSAQAPEDATPANRKEQRRLEAMQRQQRTEKLKPLKTRLAALETTIAAQETEKAALTEKLLDPEFFKKGDLAREASERFHHLEAEMEKAYTEWASVSADIESLEGDATPD